MSASHDQLHAFASGELPSSERAAFRTHLASCEACQGELHDVLQLRAIAAAPAPSRAPLRAAALLALMAALAAGVWVVNQAPEKVTLTLGATRPLEARLAYELPYRPVGVARGAQVLSEQISLQTLARLEAQGDLPALAVGQLLRSDGDRAAEALRAAPRTPEILNQLAVVALLKHTPDQALELADQALTARPGFAPALWNRALAARDLGLPLTAARDFEAVAALGEQGWSAEGAERALAARTPIEARRTEYEEALKRASAMVAGGPAFTEAQARAAPGVAREGLYRALRVVPTGARALELLPMAQQLDERTGAHTLESLVRWTAARDFAKRAPQVKRYRDVHDGKLEGPQLDAAMKALLASSERDLVLGAMLDTGGVIEDQAHYDAVAAQSEDPHFEIVALQQRAIAKIRLEGQYQAGELGLRRALLACREAHLDSLCATLQSDLADLFTQLERLAEAWALIQQSIAGARANGEFYLERYGMEASAGVARFRYSMGLASLLFHEAVAMTPGNCGVEQDANTQLLNDHVIEMQWDQARLDLARDHDCPDAPLQLNVALGAAVLYRVQHHPEDLTRGRAILATARTVPGSPSYEALGDYVEGMFAVVDDPAAARPLFRTAIAKTDKLPEWDIDRWKLRSYAYLELILEAASRGDFPEALALFSEEQGAPAAAACTLAVAADDERTLAIVVGPDGQVSGAFDRTRTTPFVDAAQAVPAALRTALEACPRVSVLARAPLHGQARLLPSSVSWSYRVPTRAVSARPASPGPKRLVISNVTPPAQLGLPHLSPWRAEPVPGQPLVELTGANATPSRALEEMADATEIEIHAHGFVDLAASEASLIALSEDAAGRYALTAGDLKLARLRGAPTVLLAACDTAHGAAQEEEPWSLPVAFVEAGARAVFATRDSIPDSEAAIFFSGLGARLRTGQTPADALRDERRPWLQRAPGSWVENVVLFE